MQPLTSRCRLSSVLVLFVLIELSGAAARAQSPNK
jgi:hypothetical protein